MKDTRKEQNLLVRQINIEHNFDEYLKGVITVAKISLSLPNISTKDLLRLLQEQKRIDLYNNLKSLIMFRELYYSKKSFIINEF